MQSRMQPKRCKNVYKHYPVIEFTSLFGSIAQSSHSWGNLILSGVEILHIRPVSRKQHATIRMCVAVTPNHRDSFPCNNAFLDGQHPLPGDASCIMMLS